MAIDPAGIRIASFPPTIAVVDACPSKAFALLEVSVVSTFMDTTSRQTFGTEATKTTF